MLKRLLILAFGVMVGSAYTQPILQRPTVFAGRELNNPAYRAVLPQLRLEEIPVVKPSLPFYDHFSYNTSVSFYTFWDTSGAQQAQAFPTNRLLFNGLNRKGSPYSTNLTDRNLGDTLTSKAIDLSIANGLNGVTLQFEWEAGMDGVAPDSAAGDSLVLYAFNPTTNGWDKLWRSPKIVDKTVRHLEKIALSSIYFDTNFRLRFQNYGLSGAQAAQWYLVSVEISHLLSLPFWEDFSQPTMYATHFKTNTGVYVNNHLAIDPPSYNVASFDGIDDLGAPYFTINNYQTNTADSLVSQPIDLSGYNPGDSLRFGFLWQMMGNGDIPDKLEGDSILLLFYSNKLGWKSVWHSSLSDTSIKATKFYPTLLTLKDSGFFHEGFRFKFVNFAKLSGMYDLWHIDYISLDSIRGTGDIVRGIDNGRLTFSDIAISRTPTSIVYPYYAIPSNHLATEAFQFAPDFTFTVSNLGSGDPGAKTGYSITRRSALETKNVAGEGANFQNKPFGSEIISQPFDGTPLQGPVTENEFEFVHKVFLDSTGGSSGNYAFRNNDTLTSIFPFKDYYAYDDGSYEYCVSLNNEKAVHALKFTNLVQDTLKFIEMCIPYNGYDLSGERILIRVWSVGSKGEPGKLLYSSARKMQYSKGRNPFTRYAIDKTLILPKGDFFIGFLQDEGGNRAARIGFDVNNDMSERYWYDNAFGSGWSQFIKIPGTIMMRPVFQNGALNLASPETVTLRKEWELDISPNPYSHTLANGLLRLNAEYDKIEIIDVVRSSVLVAVERTSEVDLTSLQSGIYIVRARLDGQTKTKRLVYKK